MISLLVKKDMPSLKDTKTGDLFASVAARGQAAYKARMTSAGFRQKNIWIRSADYERGIIDARNGAFAINQLPDSVDRLSWVIGYYQELERRSSGKNGEKSKTSEAKSSI